MKDKVSNFIKQKYVSSLMLVSPTTACHGMLLNEAAEKPLESVAYSLLSRQDIEVI